MELDESLDEAELDPLEDPELDDSEELDDPEELDDSEELEELDEPVSELDEDPVVGGGTAIETFSVALNPEPVAKHKRPISATRIRILF